MCQTLLHSQASLLAVTLELLEIEDSLGWLTVKEVLVQVPGKPVQHQVLLELQIVSAQNINIGVLRDVNDHIEKTWKIDPILLHNDFLQFLGLLLLVCSFCCLVNEWESINHEPDSDVNSDWLILLLEEDDSLAHDQFQEWQDVLFRILDDQDRVVIHKQEGNQAAVIVECWEVNNPHTLALESLSEVI